METTLLKLKIKDPKNIALEAKAKRFKEDLLKATLIFNVLAAKYALTIEELKEKNRTRDRVENRDFLMYFIRKYTKFTYPQIGFLLNRDHTTAMHAERKLLNYLEFDNVFKTKAKNLEDQILKEFELSKEKKQNLENKTLKESLKTAV